MAAQTGAGQSSSSATPMAPASRYMWSAAPSNATRAACVHALCMHLQLHSAARCLLEPLLTPVCCSQEGGAVTVQDGFLTVVDSSFTSNAASDVTPLPHPPSDPAMEVSRMPTRCPFRWTLPCIFTWSSLCSCRRVGPSPSVMTACSQSLATPSTPTQRVLGYGRRLGAVSWEGHSPDHYTNEETKATLRITTPTRKPKPLSAVLHQRGSQRGLRPHVRMRPRRGAWQRARYGRGAVGSVG